HGAPEWPMLRTIDQQLYVKPEEPGLMLSPQDETPSEAMDAQPDELDLAIAMDRFHKLCDFDVSTIHRSWAGLRTLTPDRCPAVGFSNTDKDFFWLAGQGGAGIQTAPAIGRMTADILIAGAPVNAQLDPRRFASSESAHA
ncbi:MAG: FAD-dependent oxidoreductase, partial [Pseudomonadota bacterium]|nr:FAD-dependent oxidoreductase [Pseudomonadota bacterium]